jgi:hypothetical protein
MAYESQEEKNENKFEISTHESFPGSLIVNDGREYFAIRKNAQGVYEGNSFSLMEDGSVGATYQMYESDFDRLQEIGALDAYMKASGTGGQSEQAFEQMSDREGTDTAYSSVLRILNLGGRIDPFGNGSIEAARGEIDTARGELEKLSTRQQEYVAQQFFDEMNLSNIRSFYNTYGALKGTAFADKFRELESTRLQNAGYSEFTL